MKEKWQELQPREQQLVLVMSAVIGLFLFVTLVWQPLHNGVENAQKKLTRQQELLVWIQEQTNIYKQNAGNGATNSSSKGSLSSIVNRSASRYQIKIARIQPQGDNLQVWIDTVSFDSLMDWLANLSAKEGISVIGIDLTNDEQSGVVKVRRLQLSKS